MELRMTSSAHYLESELTALVKKDPKIFEFLQEGSLDGIWYWDLEKPENEWMSQKFWETFGYSNIEKQHLAKEWQDMIYPEDLELATENFSKHCANPDHPYDQIVRYKHKDTSTVWIRCRGLVIRDEQGKPYRMLGAHQDITALKVAEENYHREKERFELAAKGASVGIWDWLDVTKNEEFWTSKFYELLGYEDQEIEASLENFSAMLHPEDQERTFSIVKKHLENMEPFDLEYRLKTKSGNYRWFRGNGYASRHNNDSPRRMVGTIQDIHEEKVRQIVLLDTIEKLKQSNQDLERFAYVASHDLQEPLRIISSYVQLIDKRYRNKLDSGADEFLEYIVDGCKRMQSLINDLLAFSRLKEDKLNKTEINLNELINTCNLSLGQLINETAAIIEHDDLPTVVGNPSQLLQLFQNLIGNSIKYAKKDQIPKIHLKGESTYSHWKISIRDNGIGINERYLEKIFEIFQRLHPIGEYSGTGIGLAICKRIVSLHGGEIWAESSENTGSVFHFTLSKKG